ncbi:LLM class flavin-dependent oxidoreductase [Paenibacillus polysaccharolyticus]|uniref:MupA/Atu3671 family FMN-dependent luciferase-like monooxygenase n=1 Tax=Paenibacillus polysaccharolyticus TaxID=582692 RepID=UPI00209CEF76|nr:MupA/Atu3671 family FMN-dependent luciferase-like monooxygenase [Paenibacillus polysaccharolyticus]MCP1132753.1 LLM class flavin-dependent oxidoreductase [Paenibacillus polysaccharolyticus]
MNMTIAKQNVEAVTDLSPLQEGMLFEHMINQEQHHVVYHYHIQANLNEELLKKALDNTTCNNETLRTIFRWENIERPVRIILKEHKVPFHFVDLVSSKSKSEQTYDISDQLELLRSKIDLQNHPFHVGLLKVQKSEWHIIIAFHHMLMDGWSNMIFMERWLKSYQNLIFSKDIKSNHEVIKYSQFINFLRNTNTEAEKKYWERFLSGYTKSSLFKKYNSSSTSFLSHKLLVGESDTKLLVNAINTHKSTLAMAVYTAWGILLQNYSQSEDVLFGIAVSGRSIALEKIEEAMGLFINTIPFRFNFDDQKTIEEVIKQCGTRFHEIVEFEHTPLTKIHEYAGLGKIDRLFDTLVVIENYPMDIARLEKNYNISVINYEVHETTPYDMTLTVTPMENNLEFTFSYNSGIFDKDFIEEFSRQFVCMLNRIVSNPTVKLEEISLLPIEEISKVYYSLERPFQIIDEGQEATIDMIFDKMALKFHDEVAVVFRDDFITYGDLQKKVDSFSNYLTTHLKVQQDDKIGICLPRSLELIIAILGVLKSGAAYIPIDPELPEERIRYLIEDSDMIALIVEEIPEDYKLSLKLIALTGWDFEKAHSKIPMRNHDANSLAYVIYTSGSTGQPKGVMIEHRNVVHFFNSLNEHIKPSSKEALLSITTVSFDISILELLWTLCNGIQVVLQAENQEQLDAHRGYLQSSDELSFSLYFFGNDSRENGTNEIYNLLLDSAIFADENGFEAVWTPERHFHEFGGIYPNPAVTGAALSSITKNVKIRAGSVVSPLHDSLRIAEDWAMIDNLSHGRAGVSFASGWHVQDFSLAPDRFHEKEDIMYKQIEEVQTLWKGGEVERRNGMGLTTSLRSYPKPIQNIPIWVTSAGNPETFEKAGKIGANVLTHLLGQDLETLKSNISIYRKALNDSGYPSTHGKVTLMIHTYLGENIDEVRDVVKGPFCNYLRSSAGLIQRFIDQINEEIDIESEDDIFELAFERYWNTSAMFGTIETCQVMVNELYEVGINEIASLIDFGIDSVRVKESLERLNQLKIIITQRKEIFRQHEQQIRPVTMFQTTPSRLKHILDEAASNHFLKSLKTIIVGGESFPVELFHQLRKRTDARIINAYGPTETTIWSALFDVDSHEVGPIPIGKPLIGECIYVVDKKLRPLPPYVPGEIVIAGFGVARGYLNKENMTKEKFIPLSSSIPGEGDFFRTGDLGVLKTDRTIEFMGRKDNQVKISGHRIELEEIETAIRGIEGVVRTVVFDYKSLEHESEMLCALVVVEGDLEKEIIREALIKQLPRYMVPQKIIIVDNIPLNASGKIDRNKAKRIDLSLFKQEEKNIPPRNNEEKEIVEIWHQVLGQTQIGISDDFFSLGGDSIKAMRVIALLKKKGFNYDVKDIFERPTIKSLVEHVSKDKPVSIPTQDKSNLQQRKRRSHYQYTQLNSQQQQQVEKVLIKKQNLGEPHNE